MPFPLIPIITEVSTNIICFIIGYSFNAISRAIRNKRKRDREKENQVEIELENLHF